MFIASFIFPSSTLAISSVNLPLDSWAYDALGKLEAQGLIDSALSGTKPYSRLESARLTAEAMKKWEDCGPKKEKPGFVEKELIPFLLERLKKEFKAELIELGVLQGSPSPTYLKPVDELIFKYGYQSDNPIFRPQNASPPTHIVYPIYNNDGIVYRKHHNFSMEVQGEGRLGNHLSLYYRPIITAFEGENVNFSLEKGYVKLEGFNIELEVGRDSLWWGPGYHGALLLTNNARPFDLIKISNPRPFVVPIIGPFKFNIFLSRLDYGDPYIHEPLLYGLRLNFKPFPILELGISHIAVFEGEGRKSLSFGDYFDILYGNVNREGTKLDSNQQVAVDFALRWPNFHKILPVARSLKFYGEWGAEDSGRPPDRRAFLLGLLINDFFLWGRIDLHLEYANTSPPEVPNSWYSHGFYPPIYHERIFGHHVGTNAEDIFFRLTACLSPKLLLGVDFDAEIQGRLDAVKTYAYQWGIDLNYQLPERMSLKGRYILQRFVDPGPIAGGDSLHHFLGLEFRWKF